MPVYSYTAIDIAGKRAGTVDARSKSSAIGLLKEQSLYVVSLDEQRDTFFDQLLAFRGVPETEIVAFTRQLSTMISAGLHIARGLEVLSEQASNKKMKKVILDILRDVQGGSTLSNALGKYPGIFTTTYVALVRAGETSGKLEEILKRLADTLEAQRDFSSRFKGAMIYPAIIFIAMIGVFILMMVFVIPKLSDMYTSMGVELPATTQFMIDASMFMQEYWYIMVVIVVVTGFGIKTLLATDQGKTTLNTVLMKLPVFGKILKQRDLTELTRTLSLLISSGIQIVDALNIVSKVVINPEYKKGIQQAALTVEKGGLLSGYLKSNRVFPPLLGQMSSVGEETGRLDEVFERIGIYFATETDHAVKGLSSALEPVILILLGGMVGVLIVSIITPIYKITSAL